MSNAQPVLKTPEFRISFPTLLVARAMKNADGTDAGKAKFGCTAVFLPGSEGKYIAGKIDLSELKKSVMAAAQEKFGDKLAALIKAGRFKTPFLKDEEEIEKRGYPPGAVYIRLTSLQKPGVVSCFKDAEGKAKVMSDAEVTERVYAGARCRASVRAFAYDTAGNKGVAIAINNLQWLGDDERWDGRSNARDEFEPTSDGADLPEPGSDEDLLDETAAVPVTAKGGKGKKDLGLEDLL
jgi:ssDNA-binding protein